MRWLHPVGLYFISLSKLIIVESGRNLGRLFIYC
jgi:hypothetical protein